MKRSPWSLVGILALASAGFLVASFAGCGSDNNVGITDADGGEGGDLEGSTGNTDGNSTVGDGGGVTDGSNFFEGGIIPDASRADTGTCGALNSGCAASADCCSANCDKTTMKCAVASSFCRQPGASCLTGLDCCTGSCIGGKCSMNQCVANTGACMQNGDCCSGSCAPNPAGGGICAAIIGPGGGGVGGTTNQPCTSNGMCVSGFCNNGTCENPSYCVQDGDACGTSADCCGGICTKTGTGTLGICGSPPKPSGTNNCLIDGTVCGGLFTGGDVTCNNSCCSRSCAPYVPTGYLICQPASGCHPEGEICASDSECCGGPGSTYADQTMVTCAGANAAMGVLGRCAIGNVCRAPGAICDPHSTMSCNTKSTCCGVKPNNSTGDLSTNTYPNICGFDNLGIPRCKTDQNLDCTADGGGNPCTPDMTGKYVCLGQACVNNTGTCTSIADCCTGLPCTIAPGAKTGICGGQLLPDGGVVPTGGGTGMDAGGGGGGNGGGTTTNDAGMVCAQYGQICTVAADCCAVNNTPIPCTNGRCLSP
jgi:hypothetical protein